MLGVHTLVAEDAADLIHPVQAAHNQPLQGQLCGDTHIHIDVQSVVVGDEGPGSGAAGNGVQHRRLYLHIAPFIQEVPDVLDELGPDDEVSLHLRVHDQIHIPLAVPELQICQAVELLRQGQQRLAQQRDVLGPDTHLAPLGAEHLTLDAHDVTDVELLELLIDRLIHLVLAGVQLDAAVPVLQVTEADLAHAPLAHQAAGHLHGPALHLVKVLLDLCRGGVPVEPGLLEGILACGLKGRQLLPPDAALLTQLLLRLLGCLLFRHVRSPLPLDLLHRVDDGAAGGLHRNGVPLLGSDQGLAEGRLLGNDAVHGVGLLRAHDAVGGHGVAVLVRHRHLAADGHHVGGGVALVHDHHVLQDLLQLCDAGIQLALLVLCLVVLAVLAQIAEAPGHLDLLRHLVRPGGLQIVQLFLQFLGAGRAHLVLSFHVDRISPILWQGGRCGRPCT